MNALQIFTNPHKPLVRWVKINYLYVWKQTVSVWSLPVCFVIQEMKEFPQILLLTPSSPSSLGDSRLHDQYQCWRSKLGPTVSDKLGPRITWKSVLGSWEEQSFKGLGWEAKKKAHFSPAWEILGLVQVWLSHIWVYGIHMALTPKEFSI